MFALTVCTKQNIVDSCEAGAWWRGQTTSVMFHDKHFKVCTQVFGVLRRYGWWTHPNLPIETRKAVALSFHFQPLKHLLVVS